MSSNIPNNATPAFKKSMNIVNSIRPSNDSIDTRCKLKSIAAHQLRKHNDKSSQKKAYELFMDIYEMQCSLRGSMSSRAMDAYKWAITTQENYNKANTRHKNAIKAERDAQNEREKKNKEKKKKELEKMEKRMNRYK